MDVDFREVLDKIKKWFFSMRTGTQTIFITILSLYILKVFWAEEVEDTCINPNIMWDHIITSLPRYILHSFVHANVLHLLFNSIALIHFSSNFEKKDDVGSVLLVYIVLIFSVLIAIFYSFVAKILSFLFISNWMETCTIGISGVLFSFITIESLQHQTVQHIRDFTINSKFNPWILLVITQIIWPKASFLGHLGGIVVGYLYNMGLLDKIMLDHSTIYLIEQRLPFDLSTSTPFERHMGGATLPIDSTGQTLGDMEDDPYIDIFPGDDYDPPPPPKFYDQPMETPLLNALMNDTNSNTNNSIAENSSSSNQENNNNANTETA